MHLLAIRFSAMGDVALTAPVIHSLLDRNPSLQITLVSNKTYEPFFNLSDRFHFHPASLKGKHKGPIGLFNLYKELKTTRYDAVVDLHDVLRSRILCAYFKSSGSRVVRFEKGRSDKRNLLNPSCDFKKLPHTTERYFFAFQALGLEIGMSDHPWKKTSISDALTQFCLANNLNQDDSLIGIAPFALHEAKIWGDDKINQLITKIKLETNGKVLLFGSRDEIPELRKVLIEHPDATIVAGNLDLETELQLMSNLAVMVSMDSSNMHLMSILGNRVVSIWGGTHHFMGFGPLGNEDLIVEVPKEELPCRPCTVYGKTENQLQRDCAKAAMKGIKVEMVFEKIQKTIQ
jgi:ADP-heptose:LPS heptosyltransferase